MQGAEDLTSVIRSVMYEIVANLPLPFHGHVITGSYNKQQGTVSVVRADTAANERTDTTGPDIRHRVVLLTSAYLDQSGPRGGEHCVVFPMAGQHACLIGHSDDTSPGAPVGERWIMHDGSASSIKFTNDGSASGDGNGAVRITGGGLASVTAPEVDVVASSVAKVMAPVVDVTASSAVNVMAPSITISSGTLSFSNGSVIFTPSGGGSSSPVIRASDLVAVITWLLTHVHSNGGGGSNTGPPTSSPPTVSGSSTFRMG